jgi:hypothetical protein
LWRAPGLDFPRWLGLAGSVVLAAGGTVSGALPASDPFTAVPALRDLRSHTGLGLFGVYLGLTVLVAAWWLVGRVPAQARAPGRLQATLALWAVPLLLGPPLFSRDVYSYLAQGAMVGAGVDVYRNGPATLGGPLAAEVAFMWQTTPAPYGPVFLLVAAGVVALTGSQVAVGVLGLRAVAVVGVVLLAVCVPRVARRCGVDPSDAFWLGVLNPLVLIHLVAGAHNDALMLGLLAAGLVATLADRPVVGTVAVTLAALVKAPAAVALLFVASIWADRLGGRWRGVRAALGTGAVAAGTGAVVTAVAGTGYGWISALGTPISPQNWSVSSALGRASEWALRILDSGVTGYAVAAWRWLGFGAAVAAGVVIWFRRERLGQVYALGLVLAAVVAFGPAMRPWYVLWGLVPLAAAAPDPRTRRWATAACAVLALAVLPNGYGPDLGDIARAAAGGMVAVAIVTAAYVLANGHGTTTSGADTAEYPP